jgi:thymidine kinase
MDGRVELIIGPMFAGKTSKLLSCMDRYRIAKKTTILVKYDKDTRYSADKIVTHNQHTSTHNVISTAKLSNCIDELWKYNVVGIDEIQFFSEIELVHSLANHGITVICAGLDGDFLGRPFGRVCELVPLAEKVTKLSAICIDCSANAGFTSRISGETEQEVIGGADKYVARCRQCMIRAGVFIV